MLNNDEIKYRAENFVNKHKSDKNEENLDEQIGKLENKGKI